MGGAFFLCNDITFTEDFSPMFADVRFTGAIEGNNRVLRGLRIDRPSDSGAAMILSTETSALIQNLVIEAPQISADLIASPLVGINKGTIRNVRVLGGTVTAQRGWAGAVAGMSNVAPVDCSTTAEISGGTTLGGLIGLLVPR